tara:strand:+ start:2932 stop:3690 length:759 start_codon:yes stop_codon:yes gene_type:complete
MPWSDVMMPIAPDYLAIERSVVECAYSGCETIWIVCSDDIEPLIRHRLGDYIQDPVMLYRYFDEFLYDKTLRQKPIPIYYVPISAHDRGKKDSMGWAALHGAFTCHKITRNISRWLKPDMFYISFPLGIYQIGFLREHRRLISRRNNFFLEFEGETVLNNKPWAFTLSWEQIKHVRHECLVNMPSIRNASLKEMFDYLELGDYNKVEIPFAQEVKDWETYCDFINGLGRKMRRPTEKILKYREFNGIPKTED